MIVTQAEFARLEGVAKSYVTALKTAGRLVITAEGLVDVDASRARLAQTADPSKEAVAKRHAAARGKKQDDPPPQNQTEKIGSSYQAARAVKEKYAAMQAKLDYERAVGEVINREAVQFMATDIATTFRVQMSSLPDTLAPPLAAMSNETDIRLLIADAIETALNDLSAKLKEIDRA